MSFVGMAAAMTVEGHGRRFLPHRIGSRSVRAGLIRHRTFTFCTLATCQPQFRGNSPTRTTGVSQNKGHTWQNDGAEGSKSGGRKVRHEYRRRGWCAKTGRIAQTGKNGGLGGGKPEKILFFEVEDDDRKIRVSRGAVAAPRRLCGCARSDGSRDNATCCSAHGFLNPVGRTGL